MAPAGEPDPRWQVMFELKEFIDTEPEALWCFAARWGCNRSQDLRSAVGCVLLEHLLPPHFELLFPRVRRLALSNSRFAWTLRMCDERFLAPRHRPRLVRLKQQMRRLHRG